MTHRWPTDKVAPPSFSARATATGWPAAAKRARHRPPKASAFKRGQPELAVSQGLQRRLPVAVSTGTRMKSAWKVERVDKLITITTSPSSGTAWEKEEPYRFRDPGRGGYAQGWWPEDPTRDSRLIVPIKTALNARDPAVVCIVLRCSSWW